MYKSLLRKNRIPSTALESLKGALFCFNFFSCSHETVSISAGGVLPQHAPTKAQASSTLLPHDPQILHPSVERVGRGILNQSVVVALEEGPGKVWCKCGAASLLNKWTNWTVCSTGSQVFHQDCHRQSENPRLPHRYLIMAWWIMPPCVLLPCYQVDMLFYSGEEVWAVSGKPAPNSRAQEGCGLPWEWKGERERETIQSTIPFLHCLPA